MTYIGETQHRGNNHKLVKVFTITSPLITVLNKKFSLALYHALYFISFIATALLSSHSPLNCAIAHVDQCPCQRQLCHLNCAKGRVSTNIQYRRPEEKTKKPCNIDLKIAKIIMFQLTNHFLLSYYLKSFPIIFPHPNEASNSVH